MSLYSRKSRFDQKDNVTEEVSYPQEEIGPDDVADLIDKLNIGTLRREQLQAANATTAGGGGRGEMDDEELEELYRSGRGNAVRNQLHRHPSKVSSISVGSYASTQSESSSGDPQISRQLSNRSQISTQSHVVETQEMGIQTTIGKSSNVLSLIQQQSDGADAKEKQHKAGTRDKVKKPLSRQSSKSSKSSKSSGDIEIRIGEEPRAPKLPQGFVVKYMGKRATKGMWGSKHTRAAVEDVIEAISKMPKSEDLPLVNLDVYYQGLEMRPHSKNKIKSFKPVKIPIQFISYGIQDTVYPRIFCFIMVKEMSSQDKSMECHVYATDSNKNARRIASCLAAAFEAYTEHLKGGAVKFSIDIQMGANADTASLDV